MRRCGAPSSWPPSRHLRSQRRQRRSRRRPRRRRRRWTKPCCRSPPLCDPLNLIPGCRNADGSINRKSSAQGNPFDNLTDDVLRKILADVTYAKALAKAAGNDVTLPCWGAWVDLVTSQTAPLKDDAGNVLTQPDPHFFVAAERASEFINQIQPNSKLYIGCSASLNQSRMAIGQLISAVLSGGALGLFKLPIP
jgi:hypothetical protein